MTKREKWVSLIYKGEDYGDVFKISNRGRIKNIKTKNIIKSHRVHLTMGVTIYYKNKSRRINIGKAQIESGLERTVEDLPGRKLKEFNKQQEELLENRYNKRILELQEEVDILKDQVSKLIIELTGKHKNQ